MDGIKRMKPGGRQTGLTGWLTTWLVAWLGVFLAAVFFSATLKNDAFAASAYRLVSQGLFVTLAALLLLPLPQRWPGLIATSLSSAAVFLLLSSWSGADAVPAAVLFRLTLLVFCLSLALWSLLQLSGALFPAQAGLRSIVALLFCTGLALPLWLGPVVELLQPGNTSLDSLIAITPLTHFSVAADYDYLRSEWFYRNTPFGSLPFHYPGFYSIVTVYLLTVGMLQLARWWVGRKFTAILATQNL